MQDTAMSCKVDATDDEVLVKLASDDTLAEGCQAKLYFTSFVPND